jgi:FtsZ-interacting cell division protein ZipA
MYKKKLTILYIMGFRLTVIVVAIIILIALLILTAYILSKQQKAKNMKAKLSHGTCPDFWSEKQSRDKMDDDVEEEDDTKPYGVEVCHNTNKLGTPIVEVMDFKDEQFAGPKGLCNKKKWANKHGLTWDGITNQSLKGC